MRALKIWYQLFRCAAGTTLSNHLDSGSYLLGKIIRLVFFVLLLWAVFQHTTSFAGYSAAATLLFFFTFNVIDVITQTIFRGLYFVGEEINRGTFDYSLVRPVSPLAYNLLRYPDILDMIFLVPIIGGYAWLIHYLGITLGALGWLQFAVTIIISLLATTAIHIMSAAFTLFSDNHDQMIWLYRESIGLARFPGEIFPHAVQLVFWYILPIFLVVALPTRALLGTIEPVQIAASALVTAVLWAIALGLWRAGLKGYSSASN